MPKINVSTTIGADAKDVFDAVKNIERFPEMMKFVKLVKIKEKKDNRIVSKWTLDIDETPIEWTEEDIIDELKRTMDFRSIKGDYQYEGKWMVVESDNGKTRVSIDAVFDWGVPNFEKHFGKVYEKKAKLALIGMLKAIKRVLENE